MILYRSVSLKELELIYDSGMSAFPARLPQQPVFYPVLDLEYARQIASEWIAKGGQSAGYVTQFKADDPYISQFEKHTVGGSQHQEFWIPGEKMEEFNRHIVGHIQVVEAHFADTFQGFIPDKFGLQAKSAAEQFTLLANSYIYKRMDFFLEIKRNHKAIFLNYPFWRIHEFKNSALKEKILQAIREAWFTSFPQNPLPMPVQEAVTHKGPPDSDPLMDPDHEDITPRRQSEPHSFMDTPPRGTAPVEQTDSDYMVDPDDQDSTVSEEMDSDSVVNTDRDDKPPMERTASHFLQGVELGLGEKNQEAIGELTKAVEEEPNLAVAHTSLGVAFHKSGEDTRALSCYEAALRIDPTYAEAHYFRANIFYDQGRLPEAIAGYTVALGLKPELIEAHQGPIPQDRLTDYIYLLAEIYKIARPAHRILQLNKILETNPKQAYLFKERAAEYYRLRNYVQAIADYSSYLAINPDDASVLHLRGVAYDQIEQHDRALEDYQRAIVVDPQLSDGYINRGVSFAQMGHFRQAIASLTEAIRLTPQNPNVYFNRGMVYFQQGDFERAIDDFSTVMRLFPADEEAYYWRGISNEEIGRQHDAIADYRQFLLISKNPQARAEIEQKLSQWSEEKQDRASNKVVFPDARHESNQVPPAQSGRDLDLYDLIVALGERALNSTWFGSGVNCHGENAAELHAFTDQNKPIEGHDLLHITSGIHHTLEGDFQALDNGATSPWIFIRAWNGSGFYIETNDNRIRNQLQTYFEQVEVVEGTSHPFEGLFIPSDQTSK